MFNTAASYRGCEKLTVAAQWNTCNTRIVSPHSSSSRSFCTPQSGRVTSPYNTCTNDHFWGLVWKSNMVWHRRRSIRSLADLPYLNLTMTTTPTNSRWSSSTRRRREPMKPVAPVKRTMLCGDSSSALPSIILPAALFGIIVASISNTMVECKYRFVSSFAAAVCCSSSQ